MADNSNNTDYFSSDYHNKSEKTVFSDKVLTLPNCLTISRLIALPFLLRFVYRIEEIGPIPAVVLGCCMIISDIADGALAKALKQISLIGAIMDPVVDKIIINSIALSLAFKGWLPFWAAILILARDLGILVFGLRIFINYGTLVTPVILARITPLCWWLVFTFSILDMHGLKWIFLIISSCLTVVSGVIYFTRYKYLLKDKNRGE